MAPSVAWQESQVTVAGLKLRLRRAGRGTPLLVLHRDIGTPDQLPIYAALTERYDVLLPEHPGYGQSERAAWMRHPRDLAAVYQGLLTALEVPPVSLVGLGYGGWIAAEMASLAPRDFTRLVLVGPMGFKPPHGDILDQALVSHVDYARAGFHDQNAFDAVYGTEPSTDQLVEWDLCREMNFRLAWKPYMHSQTLPHLLGAIQAPTLVVWGTEDRVVPLSAADRVIAGLPGATLVAVPDCGACVEMEKPAEFAQLVINFIG